MGRLITIAGPDGAGKSAVAEALVPHLESVGRVQRFHHRLRRPYQADSPPVTDPQGQVPYGRVASMLKVLYLYLDWCLGWWRHRPADGSIVLERGWWDLLVDPGRYRLRPTPRLTRFLGHHRPGDDRVVVLHAPGDVLRARKQELSAAEIDRQLDLWVSIAQREGGVVVDVDRPVEAIVDSILRSIGSDGQEQPTGRSEPDTLRWASLSTGKHRWILPVTPHRVAPSGMSIQQPMRPRAQVAWAGARIGARARLLRALPATAPPDLLHHLGPHIPPGGTLAVATRKNGTRSVALIIDRDGAPAALVKLASDHAGVAKLAREVDAVERYRPLLEAPLSAPRLFYEERGLAVFEPVRWRLRSRPWMLAPDLARALGLFHAKGESDVGGLAHGDVAPWNIMRTDLGWSLIDWEDAGDGQPAFYDVFHHLLLAQSLLGRPDEATVVVGVTGLDGWIGAAIRAYADGAGIDTDSVPEQFDDFLVQIRREGGARKNLRWTTGRTSTSASIHT